MQAFDLLPESDIQAIAQYVQFLALRGTTEARLLIDYLEDSESVNGIASAEVRAVANNQWERFHTVVELPQPTSDREPNVHRGYELFHGVGGCASCHTDYGRTPSYRYDIWGAVNRVPDLTRGEFRWGKSESDQVRKIRYGIPGSGMPANPLADADLWDLAAFVVRLSKPAQLPDDLRAKISP
jgi:mono/diheme cytochrome c family protein